MSTTTNLSSGVFEQVPWTLGGAVDNASCPLSPDGMWLLPLGDASDEVKLEAGAAPVRLSTGDWVFLYAAGGPRAEIGDDAAATRLV